MQYPYRTMHIRFEKRRKSEGPERIESCWRQCAAEANVASSESAKVRAGLADNPGLLRPEMAPA